MIPGITEVNFGPNTAASYATLHEATVTLVDMGERTISTRVRIDGDVVPNFSGWELRFKGERFVLPVKDPQAAKDNTTRNSLVDLTFRSWAIEELKRYYYFQPATTAAGTTIADKYQASIKVKLSDFVANFQSVLQYYWGSQIQMRLYSGVSDTNEYLVEIDHLKVWDVLTKFYEIFHQRWDISQMTVSGSSVTMISVGYPAASVDDHIFEYGYDTTPAAERQQYGDGYKGGLLRFERQVQDPNIANVLLGRGGEKNLPYRYFKLSKGLGGEVPASYESIDAHQYWRGDPDAIPELKDIYFDRLHDVNFRWYVRGWMHNPNRDTSGDEAWDSGHTFPTYSIDSSSPYYWAYYKGRYVDDHFDPVEFVADELAVSSGQIAPVEGSSIDKYGEHWDALDDADDIYPTIQGRDIPDDPDLGRIDKVVAVSPILTDDIKEAAKEAAVEENLRAMLVSGHFFRTAEERDANGWRHGKSLLEGTVVVSDWFTIPSGKKGVITAQWVSQNVTPLLSPLIAIDTINSVLRAKKSDGTTTTIVSWDKDVTYGPDDQSPTNLNPGTYRLEAELHIDFNDTDLSQAQAAKYAQDGVEGTFGVDAIVVNIVSGVDGEDWAPTFDIWVKDMWNVPKGIGESGDHYSERVWMPILGDRQSNEAKVVFSSGLMSVSSDYEFTIIGIPVYDTNVRYGDSMFTWRITLKKSDAEYQSTGKYIPTAELKPVAGDAFFFTGIDMPQQYVEWAEQELNTYKTAQMSELKEIAPTWVLNLDKVRAHTLEGQEVATLASRLAPGMRITTQDPRFAPAGVELYIQSLTYKWEEPSDGNPYLVPDMEIILSDKVVSQVGTVARLQGQVNSIQSEYVRADQVEDTVRRIGSAIYLKKTGESDTSESPTTFTSKIVSGDFRQGGVGGAGWGIYRSNQAAIAVGSESLEGESVVEFDKVIVRRELEVNTLVVNQISAKSGKEILSAARIEVTKVTNDNGAYQLYFDQKQGSVVNTFTVGDIALCQRFNEEWDATPTKYYRMVVTESEADHITLNPASASGAGIPEAGDVVVQYGHISNAARQYVIVRDVVGGGYEQMISGLTATEDQETHIWSYSDGAEYYFAGQQSTDANGPRWFVGNHNGEHASYQNGVLNITGRLQVLGESGSYSDLGYLADALPKRGATLIQGGLILSSTIQLGKEENNTFSIYSGLNGVMDPNALGQGVAAWYGGPMVDHEASPSAASYAMSLFRFNGSGYLAGGKIKWDASGEGEIPGISWTSNAVVISSDIKFVGNNSQLVGLVDAVKELQGMFIRHPLGNDEYAIEVNATNYKGLYSRGFISAGGLGSGSGGGGGSTVAWQTSSYADYAKLNVDSVAKDLALYGHTHDDRYYTKNAVDTALSGKASTSSVTAIEDRFDANGKLKAANTQNIEDLTHFSTKVYDASATRNPHYVLAGPASGNSAAAATFRELVKADMPSEVALKDAENTFTDTNTFRTIVPSANTTYDLGSSSARWAGVYANNFLTYGGLYLRNVSTAIYGSKINTSTGATYDDPFFRIWTNDDSTSAGYGTGDVNIGFMPANGSAATHDMNFFGKVLNFRTRHYSDSAGANLNVNSGGMGFTLSDQSLSTPAQSEIFSMNSWGIYSKKSLYFDMTDFSIHGKSGGNNKSILYYTDTWKQIVFGADTSATHDVYFNGRSLYFRVGGNDNSYNKLYVTSSYAHFYVGVESESYITAGGVNSASDIRLKKNLREVELSVRQIAEAPAVTFEWRKDGKSSAGSIAQYWQALLPNNVMENSEGMLSMEYGNIALLSAIKVARKVETQEEKIKRLEKRVAELEARLNG